MGIIKPIGKLIVGLVILGIGTLLVLSISPFFIFFWLLLTPVVFLLYYYGISWLWNYFKTFSSQLKKDRIEKD